MRELSNGNLFDSGKDIGVWLDRADGFRWAADMACQYAELDQSAREQASAEEARAAGCLENLHALSDQAVEEAFACRSEAPGSVHWFGLTCAVGALYRHYVELLLKVLIILGRRIRHEDSTFLKTHDLIRLWDEARSSMFAIWPNPDEPERQALDRATQHIKWFAEHDPNNQAFRYPSGDGLARDKALPFIDELRAHVIPLGNYLECVAKGMWDTRHVQRNNEEDVGSIGE